MADRSLTRLCATLAVGSTLAGCAQPTELVLVIDAEPRLDVTHVRVDVFGSGRGQRAETAEGETPRLPLTLGVVPQRTGVSDVTFDVAATVLTEGSDTSASLLRVVRTQFLSGSSRMVRVTFSASCIGHRCPDGESCDLEGCVPIDVAPSALPGWPGSAPSIDPRACSARPELCNGFDDDCDELVDEGIDFTTSNDDCGRCGQRCESRDCTSGLCSEEQITHVAAGGAHACVVRANGTIACWGANHERQAAGAGVAFVASPTTEPGVGFTEVAAGVDHTCAVTNDGRVACVGNGSTGALGTGLSDQSTFDTLVAASGSVRVLDTGAGFTLAVINGHVFAWGTLEGMTDGMPTELASAETFTDVTAGARHACGLLTDGTVVCRGANDRGQLGTGDRTAHAGWAPVAGLDMVADLAAGRDVTCAIRMDGSVWCWGANDAGQLGAAGADRPMAAPVPGLAAAQHVDVARAGLHACAVLLDGTVACWGDNSSGALGDGTTMQRDGVVAVPELTNAAEVACGGLGVGSGFTCVRQTTGAVACWGSDSLGQTGDGEPGVETLAPFWTIGASPLPR